MLVDILQFVVGTPAFLASTAGRCRLNGACHATNRRSFLDLQSHFAVADYPALALGEIGDVRSFRSVQSNDRLAGAVLSEKRDAGGLQYLAHRK